MRERIKNKKCDTASNSIFYTLIVHILLTSSYVDVFILSTIFGGGGL